MVFRRVPVGFNRPAWINLQRTYFALQASGDLARLDGKLFQALHEEHLPLFEEPALAEWVGKNGGDAQKFAAAYTSFGINNLTVEADKMSEDYQVTGIPTMAVAGKYIALGDTFTRAPGEHRQADRQGARRSQGGAPEEVAPRTGASGARRDLEQLAALGHPLPGGEVDGGAPRRRAAR